MKRKNDVLRMPEGTETAAGSVPPVEFGITTKSGIDLNSFEKIDLYKKYPKPAPVTSVADALSRLGNDQSKLLLILDAGLSSEAGKVARNDETGWLTYDDDGKETTTAFEGTLVSKEILNPMVLSMARILETTVLRDGKEISITWDDCKTPEEKQACKANAMEAIKAQPNVVAGLKRKMAAAVAAGTSEN